MYDKVKMEKSQEDCQSDVECVSSWVRTRLDLGCSGGSTSTVDAALFRRGIHHTALALLMNT